MAHSFTREELFDLVWSEPTRTIARRYGISDVGLAKTCRRADLLLPPRGYWAKLAAGKRVTKPTLPPRRPGMSDRIDVGPNSWGSPGYLSDALERTDPPMPIFTEPLEDLAARVRRQVGFVRKTRDVGNSYAPIDRLLKADERRRERLRESPFITWDPPLFESAFERRRLAVIRSLMGILRRVAVTVSIDGREGRELVAYVGNQGVSLTLDAVGARLADTRGSSARPRTTPMQLQIMLRRGVTTAIELWTDEGRERLERHLPDIAVAIVVQGERQHRESAFSYREWIITRRAALVEERRKQDEERQRLAKERLARLEQARVDRLLAQARALREAQEIRLYVDAVRDAQETIERPLKGIELDRWTAWALGHADRIDPIRNEQFRTTQADDGR